MSKCRSRAIAGSATVVTVPSTNTAPDPKIEPIRIQRERSVVVVRLVLSLGVDALVRLTESRCFAARMACCRVLSDRTAGSDKAARGPALRTLGTQARQTADQRFEHVAQARHE